MKSILGMLICLLVVANSYGQNINSQLLSKLDFNKEQLREIKRAYQGQQSSQALAKLLQLYRNKENLYLQLSKNDRTSLLSTFKQETDNSIRIAEQVKQQYFLFDHKWDMERTYTPYHFKEEIDWSINPFGDIEWAYMLNRHRYWQELGRAYLLTNDESYASAFVKQASHWITNNAFEKRSELESWRRLEVGMRGEFWIKTFEYFKHSPNITPEFFALLLKSLVQHAEYLASDFSGFTKTSNWGVIEFHGLLNIALFLEEFTPAEGWRKQAIEALQTTLELQVLDDGSHWEQSPMYHNAVLSNYMNVLLLAQRKHFSLPAIFKSKTRSMLQANIKWQKPNFKQPMFGDSDDTNTQDILAFGASLFEDPVMKARASEHLGYDELFTLGMKRSLVYDAIKAKQPAFRSSFLSRSGDVYMRSSWLENASYTGFHLRKLGCGHGHDDILHFDLYANQRDYLVDSGRYSYVDNDLREYFKGNRSHNTLGVDDLPNSVYKNTWENEFEARSQGVYTHLSDNFDYAEAENTAYQRLTDPVSMKRRLLFLIDNVWVVVDSFAANGKHKYSQYFNFPNDKVQIDEENNRVLTSYNKDNLVIVPVNKVDMVLEESWVSTDYNLKEKALSAEFFSNATGFTSFISLLYFPEQTTLNYKKVPVYSRRDKLLDETDVEAIALEVDGKEYIFVVVHNSPAPAENFFVVEGQYVRGEVILLEKLAQGYATTIIKE